jgi:Amt family ammonium transporter
MNRPTLRGKSRFSLASPFALALFGACAMLLVVGKAAYSQMVGTPSISAPDPLASTVANNTRSINFVWTLIAGFLVMFMQTGFALVETGMCRAKNAAHTMSMNFLVYPLAMTGFFICGFAFMMGGINGVPGGWSGPLIGGPATLGLSGTDTLNHMLYLHLFHHYWGVCGLSGFFLSAKSLTPGAMVLFLYMMVFMDTAATIPTGALAERWSFKSFAFFSLCVGGFIYSAYGCWMWGGGWLASLGVNFGMGHGAVDYAGSSVVHLQGGIMAFVLCYLIGPRIGKYDAEGFPRPIFGHHMPMVMVGTLILAFGWFGFNAGSSLSGSTDRIGVIAVNTMLASGAGTVAACVFMWKIYGKPDPSMMCNGMLGGLVSITASCAFISPLCAFFVGLIAGVLVVWSVLYFERKRIDDPVGAISVHGVCGLWGLLAVGLFANGTYGDGYNNVSGNVIGFFYGDHSSRQLMSQLVAAVACIVWNVIVAGGVFLILGRLLGANRVAPGVEIAGLDIPEMGAPGYPEFIVHVGSESIGSMDIPTGSAGGESWGGR